MSRIKRDELIELLKLMEQTPPSSLRVDAVREALRMMCFLLDKHDAGYKLELRKGRDVRPIEYPFLEFLETTTLSSHL